MLAAIQYPSWIRPEIIPGLPFRWYGMMYVVAFGVTWLLFRYESKRRGAPWTADDAASWFFWAIVGLLVGARLFGTLVYDTSGMYWERPWLIFWPFESGRFAGFQGMSYHGGFLGLIVSTLIYCRVKRLPWIAIADVIAVSAPLGYTFGRLGNFINGELWGKVSSSAMGMIFPGVPDSGRFPAREQWVQDLAAKAGIPLSSMNDIVNLPRHPSQLYEALFEGLVLWFLLWVFVRKRKSFPGFATGVYAIGYGAIRFAIEYFREPDAGLGYVLALGDKGAPTYLYGGLLNITMGQILSSFMVLGGILILIAARAAAVRAEATAAREGPQSARKLRKRIK